MSMNVSDYIYNAQTIKVTQPQRSWNWISDNEYYANDRQTIEDLRNLVRKLSDRVATLEDLCRNFKKILDMKTDKDLMKFLEDFGIE